jgi:predicted RNA-binding protein with RPS1 domain
MQTFEKRLPTFSHIRHYHREKVAQAQAEDQKKMKELLDKYHNGQIQITTTEKRQNTTPTSHTNPHKTSRRATETFPILQRETQKRARRKKALLKTSQEPHHNSTNSPQKYRDPQIYIP